MNTKKITLSEVISRLEVELIGSKDLIVGILNEDISGKNRYWFNKILDQVVKEKESFEKARLELIKKYGEEGENGQLEIKPEIDGQKNEKIDKFFEEINELLKQEVEIKFPALDLDAFDFKTTSNYKLLMDYTVQEEVV
jgi:hypothetical protein